MTKELKDALTCALEDMGTLRSGAQLDGSRSRVWSNAVGEKLSASEIGKAAAWFIQNANFFPTPHEFIAQAESMRPPAKKLRGWDVWGNTSGDWSNTDPDEAKAIFEYCWNAHNCTHGGVFPAQTEAMLKRMGAA